MSYDPIWFPHERPDIHEHDGREEQVEASLERCVGGFNPLAVKQRQRPQGDMSAVSFLRRVSLKLYMEVK